MLAVGDLYNGYSRNEWQQFQSRGLEIAPVAELTELVSVHDRLTQKDVKEIYGPLLYRSRLYPRGSV